MLNVKVAGKLVLGFQHAFVVRIRIWDVVLIIHEAFDSRVKANLSRVIYKLDMLEFYSYCVAKMSFGCEKIG